MKRYTPAIALLAALLPSIASAFPVTFQFGGTVTSASSGSPALGAPWNTSGAAAGSPVSLSYTFESTTPDINASPTVGGYALAVTGASLTINAATATFPATGTGISVSNGQAPGVDQYFVFFFGVPGATELSINLIDNTDSSFPTDALPTNLNLANFSSRTGELVADRPFGQQIKFRLDTFQAIVPEPTALCSIATFALVARRRR